MVKLPSKAALLIAIERRLTASRLLQAGSDVCRTGMQDQSGVSAFYFDSQGAIHP